MRIRFKPQARPELAAFAQFIDHPDQNKGKWSDAYPVKQPLRVELGCGKGGFVSQIALRDAQYNFLGIDIKSEILWVAKRTTEKAFAEAERSLDNILLTAHNIENIDKILSPEDEVDRIYINFCNPWYKSGHAKHRLTHPRQLIKYRQFLKPGGEIYFKTDDTPLFNDSLRYFEYTGFSVNWCTTNLHNEEPEWNIRTEHEKMFSDEGIAIKACIAKMEDAELDFHAISLVKDI